jgi:SAM-dependent methyltransferase
MLRPQVRQTDRLLVTERLVRSVSAGRVLELGAGDHSFAASSGVPRENWVCADMAPPCDVLCDFGAENAVLPFDNDIFDLVICTEVLEHLLWPQRVLNEIYRVLGATGRLLVSVPNCASLSYRIAWMVGHIPSCAACGNLPTELGNTAYPTGDGGYRGGHVIDFSLSRLRALLTYSDFQVTSWHGSGIIWHWQLLPHWLVPSSMASNLICLAEKRVD